MIGNRLFISYLIDQMTLFCIKWSLRSSKIKSILYCQVLSVTIVIIMKYNHIAISISQLHLLVNICYSDWHHHGWIWPSLIMSKLQHQFLNILRNFFVMFRAPFLPLAHSKLRLCSASHRAGYFSNMACDWLSIVWTSSEPEAENRPRI